MLKSAYASASDESTRTSGIIDKTQFSLLITVVVLSAVVPTAIAERWFLPDRKEEERRDEEPRAPVPAEEFV